MPAIRFYLLLLHQVLQCLSHDYTLTALSFPDITDESLLKNITLLKEKILELQHLKVSRKTDKDLNSTIMNVLPTLLDGLNTLDSTMNITKSRAAALS